MGWCVYLLHCADGSLYCGITNDLPARLATHNAGKGARYTRSRLPVVLRWHEACADRAEASRREWAIKQLPREAKWALIRSSTMEGVAYTETVVQQLGERAA
jgi:putative endonuclease